MDNLCGLNQINFQPNLSPKPVLYNLCGNNRILCWFVQAIPTLYLELGYLSDLDCEVQ